MINDTQPGVANPDIPFHDLVQGLTAQCLERWWEGGAALPHPWPTYSIRDQLAREAHYERFWDVVGAEAERAPRAASEQAATQERILASFASFARAGLGWRQDQVDFLLGSGFVPVANEFVRAARRFDPSISGSDIYQAGRNAWTMNGLQLLMGLPVQLTPSVLAYSLLYPYTDNYLDDPALAEDDKLEFSRRFARRLAGEPVEPQQNLERTVYSLVNMIEGHYPRASHAQVYHSLLAIHRAQEKSVRLLRHKASPYDMDVLGISLEKGGTSVLADGYLVAGNLTPAQANSLFGWGAFLQLADDLQDVEQDRRDGLSSLFSQTAGRWPLDGITDRTLQFGHQVLQSLAWSRGPHAILLKEMMAWATSQLVVGAVGRASRYYSRRYLWEMEAHSPFRFGFLARQRRKLAHRRLSFMHLIEASATPEPSAP
jgi:hypothetical protein